LQRRLLALTHEGFSRRFYFSSNRSGRSLDRSFLIRPGHIPPRAGSK
jgi:hypothetical protein